MAVIKHSVWEGLAVKPAFGDAMSAPAYKLITLQYRDVRNYSTAIGAKRHIRQIERYALFGTSNVSLERTPVDDFISDWGHRYIIVRDRDGLLVYLIRNYAAIQAFIKESE